MMARDIRDPNAIQALNELADEYEALADEIEARQPPGTDRTSSSHDGG
jgi:hypothetical protein